VGNRFAEASALIAQSWVENKDQTLDYNPDFLQSSYEYPGTDPELSPALYEGGELRAFVSGFPRRVGLQGRELKLLLLTFFTVAPDLKGKGVGTRIWAECLSRAREAGYDGAIHYCVDGNKSNHVTVRAAQTIGLESRRVFTVQYLMRLLRPGGAKKPAIDSEAGLHATFAQLSRQLSATLPFARLWDEAEIAWECTRRYGAMHALNDGQGLLTGYILENSGPSKLSVLFIEHILWDGLDEAPRAELLTELLDNAGSAEVAVVPLWGYSDMGIFRKARFRLSTRMLHAYLTLWNGMAFPDLLTPMYIDVF
jgi:GNAT superfamily N-acetyltransferase